ncbi:MAG: hypothetical protein ACREIB_00140 [Pseudomonadota bacterium]
MLNQHQRRAELVPNLIETVRSCTSPFEAGFARTSG